MGTAEADDIKEVITQTLGTIDILARALHVQDARLQPTLDSITAHAAVAHPVATDAGLILLLGGKLVPQATTGRAPQILDMKQQETSEGPCIEAARKQTLICINDLSRDPRWPEFSAEARKCQVAGMLCVPLWVNDQTLGTLSLYAPVPGAFTDHDQQLVQTFATLAALALAEAQRAEHLMSAITNRDLIGQAKGIMMERYKINEHAAFGVLKRISQAQNIKLHEIARRIAETREIPDSEAG
jgi:GAF domain-containing protein